MYPSIVGDVVAVVAKRRRVERQQPQCRGAQILEIVESRDQAGEVTYAVTVRVLKGPQVQLVYDGVFVPVLRIVTEDGRPGYWSGDARHARSRTCAPPSRATKIGTHVQAPSVSNRKMCAGILRGSSETKLRGPFHV